MYPVKAHTITFLNSGFSRKALGDLVAVHPRQADVQQHHLGPKGRGRLQGRRAGAGHLHVVAVQPQQHAQAVGGVNVVLHNKDAKGSSRQPGPRQNGFRFLSSAADSAGSLTVNSLPLPRPSLRGL